MYHKTTNQKRKFHSGYVILGTGHILSQELNKKVYEDVNVDNYGKIKMEKGEKGYNSKRKSRPSVCKNIKCYDTS